MSNYLNYFLVFTFLIGCMIMIGCEPKEENNPVDSGEPGVLEYPQYGGVFGAHIFIKDLDTDVPISGANLTVEDEAGRSYDYLTTNSSGEAFISLPRNATSYDIKSLTWYITRATASGYNGFSGSAAFTAGRAIQYGPNQGWEYPSVTFYMRHQ